MFGDIYFYAGQRNISPREVLRWTPLQTALFFGLHRPDDADDSNGQKRPSGAIDAESERLLRARELHRLDPERYPKPEARAYSPEELGMFGQSVAIPVAVRE